MLLYDYSWVAEMNLGDLEFDPMMIAVIFNGPATNAVSYKSVADCLNQILREKLEQAPKLSCRVDDGLWSCDEHPGFARAKYQGRLVCLEEVGK